MQIEYKDKDNPMVLDYRGEHVEFHYDEYGQSVYTTWRDTEYNFGTYNSMYKEDMKFLIDDYKDTIIRFDNCYGAKLTWFNNGANRDIKLTYKNRILKVFLVEDESKIDNNKIKILINQSNEILKYILANKAD